MSSAQDVWTLSRLFLAEREGVVAVFKVFLDESGTHDDSTVIAVGAYIGRPQTWRDWTKAWNKAKKPIKVMHAADCQNFKNEFEGWDAERRDAFVRPLLPVIPAHNLIGVVIGIRLEDFQAALANRPDLMEVFGSPYGACVQWTMTRVMEILAEGGKPERIAFVHEVNQYKGEAMKAFEWVKEHHNPLVSPVSLAFGSKEDFVPLQSADILAYEGAKFLRNPGSPRRAWLALDPDKNKIKAQRYGKDNLPFLISVLEHAAAVKHA